VMDNVAIRKNQAVRCDDEAGTLTTQTLTIGAAAELDGHNGRTDQLDGAYDGL